MKERWVRRMNKGKATALLLAAVMLCNLAAGNMRCYASGQSQPTEYEVATAGDATAADAQETSLEVEASAETKLALTAENFPDETFRNYLKETYDSDGDGYIVRENVTKINVNNKIVDLQGIELLTSLQELYCNDSGLTHLDVSQNVNLKRLYCHSYGESSRQNRITELDLSNNKKLVEVSCEGNELTTLIIGELPALQTLDCSRNSLRELEAVNCAKLTQLNCEENQLNTLTITGCPALEKLDCSVNALASLHISGTPVMDELNCADNHLADASFLAECPKLTVFNCQWNDITSLNLSACPLLENLKCSYNCLTALDASRNTELIKLNCSKNPLGSLILGKNTKMEILYCYQGQLTSIDVSGCTALEDFKCWGNRLTQISLNNQSNLAYFSCDYNQLTTLDMSRCPAVETVKCDNNELVSLNLSNNPLLQTLDCSSNKLESLNLSSCTNLKYLECSINRLTGLDLSNNAELLRLSCRNNLLTELDISHNPKLAYLYCPENYLTEVDTSHNPKLSGFSLSGQLSVSNAELDGIYVAAMDENGIAAGAVLVESRDKSDIEFAWYATKDDGKTWITAQDWVRGNEWLSWTPEEFGEYVLVCKTRPVGNKSCVFQSSVSVAYHPAIKGICQMPYEGEGGGYLIGIESFDNPGGKYTYEMLILDCTLLAQGKDAWIYTTGRCRAPGNCLWTIWQPQYGYYWTLFRVYDETGRLLDERCFGFANICDGTEQMSASAGHAHTWEQHGHILRDGNACRCLTDVEYNYYSYDSCGGYGSLSWTVSPSYKVCTACGEKVHEHEWKLVTGYVYRSNGEPWKDRNYYICTGCGNISVDGYNVDYYNNYLNDGFDFRYSDIKETTVYTEFK